MVNKDVYDIRQKSKNVNIIFPPRPYFLARLQLETEKFLGSNWDRVYASGIESCVGWDDNVQSSSAQSKRSWS